MPTVKSTDEIPPPVLPKSAPTAVALVEKLGFTDWHFDYDYPTPPDVRRRVQVRDDKHYAPSGDVARLAAALKRGDDVPPIVVTADGYLIDGNTRVRAAQRLEWPKMRAIVIDEQWEQANEAVNRRLKTLASAFNARHGRGIDKAEITAAIMTLAEDPKYDGTRIAALIGCPDSMVRGALAEKRARDRAAKAGVEVNGSLMASHLRRLGSTSDKLNTAPFIEILRLTQDAGLSIAELNDLIAKVRQADGDEPALALIANERANRKGQIQEFRASGKVRPSKSGLLRQRLGFVLEYRDNPEVLVERSTTFAAGHAQVVAHTISVLQRVLDMQQGQGVGHAA